MGDKIEVMMTEEGGKKTSDQISDQIATITLTSLISEALDSPGYDGATPWCRKIAAKGAREKKIVKASETMSSKKRKLPFLLPKPDIIIVTPKSSPLPRGRGRRHSHHTNKIPGLLSCLICGDSASGRHYGVMSCEGCKAFFKRINGLSPEVITKSKSCEGFCFINCCTRNSCMLCRFKQCIRMGMQLNDQSELKQPTISNVLMDPPSISDNIINNNPANPSPLSTTGSDSGMDSDTASGPKPSPFHTVVAPDGPENAELQILLIPPKCITFQWHTIIRVIQGAENTSALLNKNGADDLEIADSILYSSLYWVKSLPIIHALLDPALRLMIQSAWTDLFIICMIRIKPMIRDFLSNLLGSSTDVQLANKFLHVINSLDQLCLDDFIFGYLKVLALFSPDRCCEYGTDSGAVEIQAMAMTQLNEHIDAHFIRTAKEGRLLLHKILLILPQLRSISADDIIKMFFKSDEEVDSISIHKVIESMMFRE